jgi:hypothetical protein
MATYTVYIVPYLYKDIYNNLQIHTYELRDLNDEAIFMNLQCNNYLLICVHNFPEFSPDA